MESGQDPRAVHAGSRVMYRSAYKMALVIEFETADKIRRAIADGECKFEFNGDANVVCRIESSS